MIHLSKPPGTVVAAAVLLYAYGGMLLFCGVCSGIKLAVDDADLPGGMDDALLKEVPSYKIVEIGVLVFNLLTAAAMIVTASGLLRLMPIARSAAYVVATVEILLSLAQCAYTAFLVMPVQERIFAQEEQNLPPMWMNATMWVAVLFKIGFTLAFCMPVIFLLGSPKARAAFASEYFDPPPDGRRPRYDEYDDDDDDDGYGPPPPTSPPDTGFTDRP